MLRHARSCRDPQFSIEQGKEIGALLFGRVTYWLMAGYWPTATKSAITDYMNALPKYVFSSTLKKADWANTMLLTGDPAAEVAKLKHAEGKDIFLFGSADLSSQLMPLFDALRVGVAPFFLGSGSLGRRSRAGRKELWRPSWLPTGTMRSRSHGVTGAVLPEASNM